MISNRGMPCAKYGNEICSCGFHKLKLPTCKTTPSGSIVTLPVVCCRRWILQVSIQTHYTPSSLDSSTTFVEFSSQFLMYKLARLVLYTNFVYMSNKASLLKQISTSVDCKQLILYNSSCPQLSHWYAKLYDCVHHRSQGGEQSC